MNCTSRVDVTVGTVTSSSSVSVDPLQPVLSSVASDQVLKIINGRDSLRLCGSEEIILDRICVVAERDLDWAIRAVDVLLYCQSPCMRLAGQGFILCYDKLAGMSHASS